MAADLATRLGWGERRIDLPAGRYDTVLPPTAVSDMMIYAYWSAGARNAARRPDVFSKPGGGTRIGEEIVNRGVRLRSDPSYAGLECAPFVVAGGSSDRSSVYDNGAAARSDRLDRATGGSTSLIQTRHTADLTGQPTTPAIDNLVLDIDGGSGTEADLVAGLDDGLLLTCMWYIREVDPQTLLLTGLTRDGVYRVEGGEITGAVNNFRLQREPDRPAPPLHARLRDRAELLARVGRGLLLPHRHPGAAHPRLQHELGLPGTRSYGRACDRSRA